MSEPDVPPPEFHHPDFDDEDAEYTSVPISADESIRLHFEPFFGGDVFQRRPPFYLRRISNPWLAFSNSEDEPAFAPLLNQKLRLNRRKSPKIGIYAIVTLNEATLEEARSFVGYDETWPNWPDQELLGVQAYLSNSYLITFRNDDGYSGVFYLPAYKVLRNGELAGTTSHYNSLPNRSKDLGLASIKCLGSNLIPRWLLESSSRQAMQNPDENMVFKAVNRRGDYTFAGQKISDGKYLLTEIREQKKFILYKNSDEVPANSTVFFSSRKGVVVEHP